VGYQVSATAMSVRIRIEDEDAAFRAMVRFNEECPPEMKRGMSLDYDGTGEERRWFSWMRADFSEYDGLGPILHEMGFSYDLVDGWIVLTNWHGDKQGQEGLLMEAIASWVEPGSHVEWVGEDCARWRWEFSKNGMRVREATTGWSSLSSTPTELRLTEVANAARLGSLLAKSTSGAG